jgi:hypothetical protein
MNTALREVIVNPEPKLGGKYVVATPEVNIAFGWDGEVAPAFQTVDDGFMKDPEAKLRSLHESLFSFPSVTGANIKCSLIPGKGNKLLMMWAPFSDGAPNSDADSMVRWVLNDSQKPISKSQAAPNSWNQITKSSTVADLLEAAGHDMSVLTIFSPLPSVPHNAYTHEEYKWIRQGDFTPSARLALQAIAEAQRWLHGQRSETQLDEVHLHGASLGASNAIGAASGLLDQDVLSVRSVTAQELILGPQNVLLDLSRRFILKDPIGEPSQSVDHELYPHIPEPRLRQMIEREGNELMMVAHMLQGMSKLSRLKGLTRPERNQTPRLITRLLERDVEVLIPLAETSGVTYDTPDYLPNNGEQVVAVRGIEGQRTSHMIDEQVALTALMAVMNVIKAERKAA